MTTWLIALLVVVGFMVARGLAMLYLAVRTNRAHILLDRYWSDEADLSEVGRRKSGIIR